MSSASSTQSLSPVTFFVRRVCASRRQPFCIISRYSWFTLTTPRAMAGGLQDTQGFLRYVRYVRYVIGTTLSGTGQLPSRPHSRGLPPAPHQTPVEDGLISLTWSGTAAPKVVREIRFDRFVDPLLSGTDVSRYRGSTFFNGWVVVASQPADLNPSRVTWLSPGGTAVSHSPIVRSGV